MRAVLPFFAGQLEDILEMLGIDHSVEYSYTVVANKLTLNDGKKDMEFTKK